MKSPLSDARAPSTIDESAYLRERSRPTPGDPLYLHLSDLRLALGNVLPKQGLRVLDFGCGGSPYRGLFKGCVYHRADLPGMPDLDYTFGESSVLSAPAASYDYVLSTQVLEHVKEPAGYLAECRRLLGPDGQLVLTTHGLFPDHACPFDFQRWTADGLRLAVEQAGLKIEQVLKLSTNGRALVTFNQMFNDRLLVRKKSIAGYALRLSRLVYTRLNPARLNQMCDEEYADCRVVAAETPGHELYIALMVVARRAGESA